MTQEIAGREFRLVVWAILLSPLMAGLGDPPRPAGVSIVPGATDAVASDGVVLPVMILVTDSSGKPLSGQKIEVTAEPGTIDGIRSNGNGTYTATYVAPAQTDRDRVYFTAKVQGIVGRTNIPLIPGAAVSVEPQRVRGGSATPVQIRISSKLPAKRLRLRASAGAISPLTPDGAAAYTASFMAPAQARPRLVVVTVHDAGQGYRLIGRATIAIIGRTEFEFETEPGSRVTARLGERDLGAFDVDASGQVVIPFEASPGDTLAPLKITAVDPAGNESKLDLDLGVPHDDIFSLHADPPAIMAGTHPFARITAVLFSKAGRPLPGLGVTMTADGGKLSPVRDNGDGTYTVFLVAGAKQEVLITATTRLGETPLRATTRVRVSPGFPAKLEISADPERIPANGFSTSELTLVLTDVVGNHLEGYEIELATSAGRVTEPRETGAGIYSAVLTAPAEAGTGRITITARVRPEARAGTPTGILTLVLPDGDPQRARVMTIVRDSEGRPVPSVNVSHLLIGPGGLPAEATTDATGVATVTFSGTGAPGLAMVEARVANGTTTLSSHAWVPKNIPIGSLETIFPWLTILQPAALPVQTSLESPFELALISPELAGRTVTLTAEPYTLPPDGTSTARLTVRITDESGRPVAGKGVRIDAPQGTVGAVRDNGDGTYTSTYTAPLSTEEGQVVLTAQNTTDVTTSNSMTLYLVIDRGPAVVSVTPSVASIIADPTLTFTVTAEVTTAAGQPVPDGTSVDFSFGGSSQSATTTAGKAAVTFNAVAPAGPQTITAVAGPANGSASVTLLPGAPATIVLTLQPDTLPADPSNSFEATAVVKDAGGNAVADGTLVTFTRGTDSIQAATAGGQATGSLPAGSESGTFPVMATSGAASGSADVTFNAGTPAQIVVTATPQTMTDDSSNTFEVTADVSDGGGDPVADGTDVAFVFDGTTQNATTTGGKATVTYNAKADPGAETVTATAGSINGQTTVTMTAGDPAQITLSATPVQVNVSASSDLTIEVKDAHGHFVEDGTQVSLSAVLGSVPASVTTTGGQATAQFIADTSPGNGSVTATAGSASQNQNITVLGGEPNDITVIASPTTLISNGTSTSIIEAEVRDAFGNLVEGEQINFSISPTGGIESVLPATAYTNANGIAKTTFTAGILPGDFVVTAAANSNPSVSGTVTITQTSTGTRVVVISGTEKKGDDNDVELTIEVQDDAGNPMVGHADFTATISLTGSATTSDTVTIPNGSSSTTVEIEDTVAEIVVVSLNETSSTGMLLVNGTATFIPGKGKFAVVVSAVEPSPGDANSITITIEVHDKHGNLASKHKDYAATVGVDGSASVVGSPISLPDGFASTTVTVNDTAVEIVNVTLTETTGDKLDEVNGTATFIPGKPTQVVVIDATEPAPGVSNAVTLTVEVRDATGNPTSSHPLYSATLTLTGSATTGSTVLLLPGSASTTVTIDDSQAESVTVGLSETSATGLAEGSGTATFVAGTAADVVVISGVEAAPGSVNSVIITIEVRDANGNIQSTHPAYTATVGVDGSASITGSPITIASGIASATVTVDDSVAEAVNVTLTETSATGLNEINGTATFVSDPTATQVVVVSDTEAAPGTANSVTLTIEVRDTDGNAQPTHTPYAATVAVDGDAAVTGSPISIPDGSSSTTVTVNDTSAEAVNVTLVETSNTNFAEVNGTATFIASTAAEVVVVSTMEPNPGTANSVTVTIEVRDADGNLQTIHSAYSATVSVDGSATITGSPISIPDGTASTTVTVDDAIAETVNVTLVETSATGLGEVAGTATFIAPVTLSLASKVVVVSGTEPGPGTSNSITITFEVRDGADNPMSTHPAYTAEVHVDGSATVSAGSTISIPDGTVSVTKTINDVVAEVVNVTLVQTTATNLTEVDGTATFIPSAAVTIKVIDVSEPLPGTSDSVTVTIEIRDSDNNPQPTHGTYTASVADDSATATVTGSPISIASGVASTTVTVSNTSVGETVNVSLSEISDPDGLTEVDGDVTFLAGPTQIVAVSATEPGDGTGTQIEMILEIRDDSGNPIGSHGAYTGTVSVDGSATLPGGGSFTIPVGVATTSILINDAEAEAVNVIITPVSDPDGLTEVAGTAVFSVGPTDHFVVVVGGPQQSGVPFTGVCAVTAKDAGGGTITDFSSSGSSVTMTHNGATGGDISGLTGPGNSTLNKSRFVNGVADLVVEEMVFTSASLSELVQFTATSGGATGTSGGVVFESADSGIAGTEVAVIPATESGDGSGNSNFIILEIRDGGGAATSNHSTYQGTVSVDGSATLPSGGGFTIASGETIAIVEITDTVAEVVLVTITQVLDPDGLTEGAGTATFVVGPPADFAIVIASPQQDGQAFSGTCTVTALDADGNTITNYDTTGTNVTMTYNGAAGGDISGLATGQGDRVQDTDFVSGVADLSTLGMQFASGNPPEAVTFTATAGSANGTSNPVAIENPDDGNPADEVFVFSATEPPDGSGNVIYILIQTRLSGGDPTTNHANYQGTVSVDGSATLPAGGSFTINSGETGAIVEIRDTAGEVVNVTITEDSATTLTEVNGTATFTFGPLDHFDVAVAGPQESGVAFSGVSTITAKDAGGSTITDYDLTGDTVKMSHDGAGGGAISGLAGGDEILKTSFVSGVADPSALGMVFTSASIPEVVRFTATSNGKTGTSGNVVIQGTPIVFASQVVVVDVTESPASVNSVTMTFEVRGALGNPVTSHPAYTARISVDGSASVFPDNTISIPDGTASVTKTINDSAAEAVNVTLQETSGTNLSEVAGTATFFADIATRVAVLSAMEAVPGTSDSVVITIEVRDDDDNPQVTHGAYAATVSVGGSASVTPTSITIPDGTASVTVTVDDIVAETVTVSLSETSGTALIEVPGDATFIDPATGSAAVEVEAISVTESAPGTSNSVTMTFEVQDDVGNSITTHPTYSAKIVLSGSATIGGGNTISIPDGTASVTKTITDSVAEVVTVTLIETSATNLNEVNGTATFIIGPAVNVRAVSAAEPVPGTANTMTMTIQVEDGDGNLVPSPAAYNATISASGGATVVGSPISIPDGTSSTTITVNDALDEDATITLTETSATALGEIAGIASFFNGPATQVVVIDATEPAPGTADSVSVTIVIRDDDGNPVTLHDDFTANVNVTGSASVSGSPITILNGASSTNVMVNDNAAEVVTVSLSETTATGLAAVNGTATFIIGTAAQVVVGSVVEPAPGTIDSVTVQIKVRDANGNLQSSHPAYTANIDLGASSATATPSSISIPDGTDTVSLTIDDIFAEVVIVTLIETSATALTEVNGTATFIDDPPVAIIAVSATTIETGQPVSFDGSQSYALEPFVINGYFWDFDGDGATDSTLAVPPPYIYTIPGNYALTLRVTDTGGYEDIATIMIYVGDAGEPTGPIALTASPLAVPADGVSTISFNSGVITDPAGDPVADGTPITVFASHGTVLAPDAGSEPGIQVATSGGVISFDLQAGTDPAMAQVTAQSLSGSASGSKTITFTGDSDPPIVTAFSPSGVVTLNPPTVDVTFNELINPGTLVPGSLTVTGSLTGTVAGSLSYLPEQKQATFTIEGPVDVATEVYTVVVSGTIEDDSGNAMGADFSFTFGAVGDTTPPTVSNAAASPSPFSPDGDGDADSATLSATVNDDVGVESVYVRILSGGQVIRTLVTNAPVAVSWDGRDESGGVVEDGLYTFEITAYDAAWNASAPAGGTVEVENPIQFGDYGP